VGLTVEHADGRADDVVGDALRGVMHPGRALAPTMTVGTRMDDSAPASSAGTGPPDCGGPVPFTSYAMRVPSAETTMLMCAPVRRRRPRAGRLRHECALSRRRDLLLPLHGSSDTPLKTNGLSCPLRQPPLGGLAARATRPPRGSARRAAHRVIPSLRQ
jgi:hypothetical protein